MPPRRQREASFRGNYAARISFRVGAPPSPPGLVLGPSVSRSRVGNHAGLRLCPASQPSRGASACGVVLGGSGRGYEKPFLRGYVKGRRALSSSRHTRRPPVAEMPAGKGGPSLCPQAGLCWPQAKSGSTPRWLCPRRGDSSLLGMSFVSRYWKAMRSSGFRETSLNREKHPFPEIEMKRH